MNRAAFVTALVAAAVLAGASVPTAADVPPDQQRAEDALLTAQEIGAGSMAADDFHPRIPPVPKGSECREVRRADQAAGKLANATVRIGAVDGSFSVHERVLVFDEFDAAEEFLDRHVGVEECIGLLLFDRFSQDLGGEEAAVAVNEVEFSGVGEGSVGYQATFDVTGGDGTVTQFVVDFVMILLEDEEGGGGAILTLILDGIADEDVPTLAELAEEQFLDPQLARDALLTTDEVNRAVGPADALDFDGIAIPSARECRALREAEELARDAEVGAAAFAGTSFSILEQVILFENGSDGEEYLELHSDAAECIGLVIFSLLQESGSVGEEASVEVNPIPLPMFSTKTQFLQGYTATFGVAAPDGTEQQFTVDYLMLLYKENEDLARNDDGERGAVVTLVFNGFTHASNPNLVVFAESHFFFDIFR